MQEIDNPTINYENLLLNLKFENYKMSITPDEDSAHLAYDCICRYNSTWKILGLEDTTNIKIKLNHLYFDNNKSKWTLQ